MSVLPNPYYMPELRPLTGIDAEVKDYVLKSPLTKEFLDKYSQLLNFLIPLYIAEGKNHLVIAIGCTGTTSSQLPSLIIWERSL